MNALYRIAGRLTEIALLLALAGLSATHATAAETVSDPVRFAVPPVIDGNLDDAAWRDVEPFDPAFITVDPRYGDTMPEKTMIWMGYDDSNLYFAFRCFDSQPGRIKATFTARDQIDDNDAVAVALDSDFNQQLSRWFIVNPYGIQRDMINFDDESIDWIWYSAGRMTPEGYEAELAIPLTSLSYRGGAEVPMGILFARAITRESMLAAWPPVRPEQNVNTALTTVVYRDLPNPQSIEVLPIATYGAGSSRVRPGQWGNGFTSREFGGNLKYRYSSAMTLEATVNPDFSHVESDAYQMDLNQRYPIFYSEKRPFFMEGMDVFGLSYGGGNISTPMNTRAILSPTASVKLTGTGSRVAYGALIADDSGENPFQPNEPGIGDSRYAVGRVKFITGGENYVGLLYSGHTKTETGNRVIAADSYYRSGNHTLRLTGFATSSRAASGNRPDNGGAGIVSYNFMSIPLDFNGSLESFSKDFRMDTAFYNRTGFHRAGINITPHYFTRFPRFNALQEISPYVNASYVHDMNIGRDDHYFDSGVNFNFVRSGRANVYISSGREHWAGHVFDLRGAGCSGGLQLNHRITINGWFNDGRSIYYDSTAPWLGHSRSYGGDLDVQLIDRLSQMICGQHSELYRLGDGFKGYSVNIVNSRTTYQFNKYFFIRAIVQYNSGSQRLLSDLLASFTLVPGTVFFVGYGGISQRDEWDGTEWRQDNNASFVPLERRFFMKISYLYRY